MTGDDRQERLDFVELTRKIRFMVDLRRLRALRAVADHGTLAAAADALHLTPSRGLAAAGRARDASSATRCSSRRGAACG